MQRSVMGRLALGVVLVAALAGCGEDEPPAPPCSMLDGVCVGVPAGPICEEATCTQGVTCAALHAVSSEVELSDALERALAGDCITLAPGSYGDVALPGGVSLLGRSAAEVRVAAVTLGEGSGAWLRGMEIRGGIDVGSATAVRIEATRIVGADRGLRLAAGASATVVSSEVAGAREHGILGRGFASLAVERSVVKGGEGPGLWLQCAEAGCDCTEKPSVTIDHVLVTGNRLVSTNLVGVSATMRSVHLIETRAEGFTPGGGLSVGGCADLGYAALRIEQTGSYGLLIDSASARPLGNSLEDKGIVVIGGKPGIWVQRVAGDDPSQEVVLDGIDVRACGGTGLGFDLSARGIVVIGGKVAGTVNVTMPVEPAIQGRQADVGMGVMWKAGSTATIQSLELSGNQGIGLLIDGSVGEGSGISGLAFSGGDEDDGVVQQQVGMETMAPEVNGVELQQSPEKVAEVPVGPSAPSM